MAKPQNRLHLKETDMRSFDDSQGGHWQAAVMEASFGNTLIVFSRIGDDAVRKTVLEAETLRAAERDLATMQEPRLRTLLDQAEPWA